MATIDVKDAAGNTVPLEKPLAAGRAAAAASRPVALSTEDAAALALLHTDLATTLAGFLDGLEALIGTTNSGNAAILAKLSADPATQTTLAALLAAAGAAQPAGENHIGAIGGNTSYVDVVLALDTVAYTAGDLMSDRQVITNAMRVNDGTGVLQSIQVLDEDDQGAAFDIILLAANSTFGTVNVAPTVTDAVARDILGSVSVAAADFIDLGGCRIATKTGIGLVVKPATGTRNLYVATITRGTPTYTAAGVRLRLGFLQD